MFASLPDEQERGRKCNADGESIRCVASSPFGQRVNDADSQKHCTENSEVENIPVHVVLPFLTICSRYDPAGIWQFGAG
jgi:hypothetical protein